MKKSVNSVTVFYDEFNNTPLDVVKPLSGTEQKRRVELEEVITRNFTAFYEVGCALREIRERQLYRNTHDRFDHYCKELWEINRSHAYRMIDASFIVDSIKQISLSPIGDKVEWIPQNESQARALIKFKNNAADIHTIVTEAVATAPSGKMTAAHLKKIARSLHSENVKKAIGTAKTKTNQTRKISEDFRRTFNQFMDVINIERANKYKHTDQNEVIRHVRIIIEALEAEL